MDKIINPLETIILIDGNIMPDFKKNFSSEIKLVKKGDAIVIETPTPGGYGKRK